MTLYKDLSVPGMPAYTVCGILVRHHNGTRIITIGWYELRIGRAELSLGKSWHHPAIKRELRRLLSK